MTLVIPVDQAGMSSILPSFIPTVALIALLVAVWAVWASPKGCEWVAQTLRARAAGLKAYRDVYDTMRPKREGEEVREMNKAINYRGPSSDLKWEATTGRTIGDDL